MIKNVLMVLSIYFLIVSCASVEKQEKKWTAKVATMEKYINNFPTIAPVLNEQLAMATKAYEKAVAESDEKLKIKMMGEALDMLNAKPLATITSFERNIQRNEEVISDIKTKFRADEFDNKTMLMLTEARQVSDKSNEILRSNYNSANEALAAFESQSRLLQNVSNDLSKHYKNVLASRPTETEGDDSTVTEDGTKINPSQSQSTTADLQKCKKCGVKSPADAVKCKSCGANF